MVFPNSICEEKFIWRVYVIMLNGIFPLQTPLDILKNQYSAIYSWYYKGVCNQIDKINMPTLIIVGTKDILTPPPSKFIDVISKDSRFVVD